MTQGTTTSNSLGQTQTREVSVYGQCLTPADHQGIYWLITALYYCATPLHCITCVLYIVYSLSAALSIFITRGSQGTAQFFCQAELQTKIKDHNRALSFSVTKKILKKLQMIQHNKISL